VILILKPLHKYILTLILFEILILITGSLLTMKSDPGFNFPEITILSLSFAVLSLLILIIFFMGQKKDQEGQTMHILVALGIKFIVELVIALLWFFVAKKTGLSLVILFFVLYLAFTLFLVLIVLKTLIHKSL